MALLNRCAVLPLLMLGLSSDALASDKAEEEEPTQKNDLLRTLADNVQNTGLHSIHRDVYLPLISWHNRYTYNDEHLQRYNERPWGIGYGVSRRDEQDNWHSLYAMAFKDSFNHWEPIVGYGWEAQWRPMADKDFTLGAGYTLGVTSRHNWNYYPIPVILPLASVGYKNFTLQGTYIPGTRNNGNVLFAWLRWEFKTG